MTNDRKNFIKLIAISLTLTIVTFALLLWYLNRTPRMGGEFVLESATGPWRLSEHPKPLTLLYFGYVKCPDVCPMTLSHAAGAFRKLTKAELEKTQLVFVNVDVAHDKPADADAFARQFFSGFKGLSGTVAQIDTAVNLFGASYMIEPDAKSYLGYSIAHSDRIYLLNEYGKVLDSISSPRSSDPITAKIKENL